MLNIPFNCALFVFTVKPVKVKIVSANEVLTAGVKSPLRCEAWGSAPPGSCLICYKLGEINRNETKTIFFMQFKAKITWFLDGIPIIHADITSHSDNTEEASNQEMLPSVTCDNS